MPLQLPPSPIPEPSLPLISPLRFKHRGRAGRAEIGLALGPSKLRPVQTCPLAIREEGVSLNTDFSCPPSQHKTPWHEFTLQKPQYLHRLRGQDLLRAQLLVLIFSFLKKKVEIENYRKELLLVVQSPSLPQNESHKPPTAACNGIMSWRGEERGLERPSMCKQDISIPRKSGHVATETLI